MMVNAVITNTNQPQPFDVLIYPNGHFLKDDVREILEYALEGRGRVKEQLKKIGDMKFYDVHFSYC